MAKDVKIICPLMGGKPCIEDGSIIDNELVACRFWVKVRGMNPQTKVEMDNGDCSMAWLPILLIDNTNINRSTSANIEKLRDENATTGQQLTAAIIQASTSNKQVPYYGLHSNGAELLEAKAEG